VALILLIWLALGRCRLIQRLRNERSQHRIADDVFHAAPSGIAVTDLHGEIVEVNEAFGRITGYLSHEVIGQDLSVLLSGHEDRTFYESLWDQVRSAGFWQGEAWSRRKTGEIFAELLTISTIENSPTGRSGYVAMFSDITARMSAHQQALKYSAQHHPLTGLPNRVLFEQRLREARRRCTQNGGRLAAVYLDIDRFTQLNDQHGEAFGDEVLQTLAGRLSAILKPNDTLAHLSGDDFAFVIEDAGCAEDLTAHLSAITETLREPIELLEERVSLSAGIGVTVFPDDGADADTLLRHAHGAMYEAKIRGRNRVQYYDVALGAQADADAEIVPRVERALDQGELCLFYQPKVDMRQRKVVGAEALIRWFDPERGLVEPGGFLPALEGHDLAVPIGNWVIDTALGQIAAWQAQGIDLPVSINVVARHLLADDFVDQLRSALMARPEAGRCLGIEILESAAMTDMDRAADVVRACQRFGVEISLDDFGTGFSSLNFAKYLPADVLKIDRNFVRDMCLDRGDRAIVQGVISLAHALDRQVVAEGVETPAQSELLMKLGCDIGQGHGIARPMPAEALPEWIQGWESQDTPLRRGQPSH